MQGTVCCDSSNRDIVQASPSGHAAPLQVDISLPFKIHGRREAPAEQLPLQRLPDGSVQIRHERQCIDAGEDALQGCLSAIQTLLSWLCISKGQAAHLYCEKRRDWMYMAL